VLELDHESFRLYLRKKGKKDSVVERNIKSVIDFHDYLTDLKKEFSEVSTNEIESYISGIEKEGGSAKGPLYVLINYFKYLENQELYSHSSSLREQRTSKSRRIFPLKEFLGIDLITIEKLGSIGIKNVEQMLESGKTREQREQLAKSLGISVESVLELVILSDITRIGYVKAKLSRLY
jgi:hypothetical protein